MLILLKYYVTLLPFEATAFSPLQPKNKPVGSEAVEVTTNLGPGPEPKAHAPPGYDYGQRNPPLTAAFNAWHNPG
jgi:hypothetical protein